MHMDRWTMRAGLWALAILLLPCGEASADPAPELAGPREVITQRYAVMDRIIASGAPVEAMRKEIQGSMGAFVDFTELARLTIRREWAGMTKKKRVEFAALLQTLISRTYAKRFEPDHSLKVVFDGDAEIRKGRARLRTTVSSGRTTADVEYRMHQPPERPGWWTYDIVIDDVSLMRNYRAQFQKILKDGGSVETLLERLRKQTSE